MSPLVWKVGVNQTVNTTIHVSTWLRDHWMKLWACFIRIRDQKRTQEFFFFKRIGTTALVQLWNWVCLAWFELLSSFHRILICCFVNCNYKLRWSVRENLQSTASTTTVISKAITRKSRIIIVKLDIWVCFLKLQTRHDRRIRVEY